MLFLSDGWVDRLGQLLEDLPQVVGRDGRWLFQTHGPEGHVPLALEVCDGVVASCRRRLLADADVEIHWSVEDALAIFTGSLSGTEAMARTSISEVRSGGRRYVGPPPPVDILLEPSRQLMPRKPGVSIRASYELLRGPFGDFEITAEWRDGVLVEMSFTVEEQPAVMIGATFRNLVRLRRGEMEPFDALGGGRIEGSQGRLALLAGIHEDPDWRALQRACAQERAGPALSTLGDLWAEPAFVDARRTLRNETARPEAAPSDVVRISPSWP